ncbi:hypothetical protein FRC00_014165, partial [Tulasnella sp. 408]
MWRRHVLDMPLLWNRLEFATDAPQWDMVEVKLQRSGQAPLDIVLKEKVFLKSGMPHLRRIMRMIVPHMERWRSVRMVDVPHKVRRVLLDQLRGKSTLLLQRVEVVQQRQYDRTPGCRIKNTSRHWDARRVFDGAPNLRHLRWTSPEAECLLLPPFRNLLTLTIGHGTLDIAPEKFIQLALHILAACPTLRVLSIPLGPDSDDDTDCEDVEHLVQPPVTHSSLKLLRVTSKTSIRSAILRSLILPELRSLGEASFDTAEVNILCCQAIAQSNSVPKLRGVVVASNLDDHFGHHPAFYPHTYSLPSAINNLGGLVALVFRFVNFGGNNRWLPNLGNCCPRLKSLMLLYCTGYTVKGIQDIVEMRILEEGIESLAELRIHGGDREGVPNNEEATWFSQALEFN